MAFAVTVPFLTYINSSWQLATLIVKLKINMIRVWAFIFGIVFLAISVLGFRHDLLAKTPFGTFFHFNLWLNILHLATGLSALLAGFLTTKGAKFYFQLIGFIYAILSVLGFAYGDREILEYIASNKAMTWLHVILAVGALIIGYGEREKGEI